MAEKACHVFGSTTQVGLTQALAPSTKGIGTVKLKEIILATTLALLSGCATTSSPVQSQRIQPIQAVQLAAAAAPRVVPGLFALHVQATGTQDNFIYLNSELDYRDQRNLTIAITPSAATQLEARLGASPLVALKGKSILVNGSAYRAKIVFIADGKQTDKYYYQTHVRVSEPDQIEIQDGG